jgi:hypothetical protein
MRWWQQGPWADRDRVGVQLAWSGVLVAMFVVFFLVMGKIVF